jgi:sec-independent protein translocase protein TatB
VFGFSFGELVVICVVALIAVGPQKLPGLLKTLGQWIRKLQRLTSEVRTQTGIDDILRAEGLHGGLNELRGLLRGAHTPFPPLTTPSAPAQTSPVGEDPYANIETDLSREYPNEGADSYGALPDDLIDDDPEAATATAAATAGEAPKPP